MLEHTYFIASAVDAAAAVTPSAAVMTRSGQM